MIGGKRGFGQLRSEKAAEVAIEDAHSNLSRNALGRQGAQVAEQHEPDSEDESRDHKRLRLAREYLERIGAGTKPSDGSDAVAAKLDADADLETQAGVREIALDLVGTVWADRARFMKGHDVSACNGLLSYAGRLEIRFCGCYLLPSAPTVYLLAVATYLCR